MRRAGVAAPRRARPVAACSPVCIWGTVSGWGLCGPALIPVTTPVALGLNDVAAALVVWVTRGDAGCLVRATSSP